MSKQAMILEYNSDNFSSKSLEPNFNYGEFAIIKDKFFPQNLWNFQNKFLSLQRQNYLCGTNDAAERAAIFVSAMVINGAKALDIKNRLHRVGVSQETCESIRGISTDKPDSA